MLLKDFLCGPAFAGWVVIVSKLVGVAIVLPIAFAVLSAEDIVLWLLFSSFASFQFLLDFGLNSTFSRFIAYSRATPRDDCSGSVVPLREDKFIFPLSSIVRVMPGMYFKTSVFTCLAAFLLVSFFVYKPISRSSAPFLHWILWGFLGLFVLAQTYCGKYTAILHGVEKVATQRRIEAVVGVANSALCVAALILTHSLVVAMISIFAVGLLGSLSYRKFAKSCMALSDPTNFLSGDIGSIRRDVWRSAWRSGIGVLASAGIIQILNISTGSLLPAEKASSFLFGMRIAAVISSLSQASFYSYLPGFAKTYRERNFSKLLRDSRKKMLAANTVLSVGFVLAVLLMNPMIEILGIKLLPVSSTMWLAIAFSFSLERVGAMHMQLYTLGGRVIWHWANGITGIFMLGMSYVLFGYFGELGIPLGMALAYLLVYCPISILASYRLLKINFLNFDLYSTLPPLLLSLLALSFVVWVGV